MQRHPWLDRYPPKVDWHEALPSAPLHELLIRAARDFGDRPAYRFLGRRTTWREAARDASHAAAGLQAMGLRPGMRIGLMLPNCPAYPTVFFGALMAGLTVVNFSPLYTVHELEAQARDADIALMATLDLAALLPKAEALLASGVIGRVLVCSFAAQLPLSKALAFRMFKRREIAAVPRDDRHPRLGQLLRARARPAPVAVDPARDVAVLQYTGGTSGTPKGAMLSHANLHANALQGVRWFHDVGPGQERMLAALPFFHVFALSTVLLFSVAAAAEIVMLPRFVLKDAIRAIGRTRPTYMPGVPTMFNAIAAFEGRADLSSIRCCISGGAPLPVEVKRRFEARTGCVVVEGYGLTEASPCICCNPPSGVNKGGTVGLPMTATIVELRDPEDPARSTPPGERGEICVRGPQVMLGYWRRPEETRAAFTPDGLLRTADIGLMDEDGYVSVVDRIKDLILCGGFNVYPRMVEDAVYRHPAVAECTVIGVPDAYRGETVKAFVVRKPGESLTEAELCAFLREYLSAVEMPKRIEFRDSLPKTLVGKLSKKELVAEERGRAAADAA